MSVFNFASESHEQPQHEGGSLHNEPLGGVVARPRFRLFVRPLPHPDLENLNLHREIVYDIAYHIQYVNWNDVNTLMPRLNNRIDIVHSPGAIEIIVDHGDAAALIVGLRTAIDELITREQRREQLAGVAISVTNRVVNTVDTANLTFSAAICAGAGVLAAASVAPVMTGLTATVFASAAAAAVVSPTLVAHVTVRAEELLEEVRDAVRFPSFQLVTAGTASVTTAAVAITTALNAPVLFNGAMAVGAAAAAALAVTREQARRIVPAQEPERRSIAAPEPTRRRTLSPPPEPEEGSAKRTRID